MKLRIIPNEQTPEVDTFESAQVLIDHDRKLLEKFIVFVQKQHSCAGLAANQVSVDGNRIMELFFAIKDSTTPLPFWEIIIHPKILKYKGKKELKTEGCLTWIGKDIIVDRYPEIKVNYFNLKGEEVSKNISGFKAQVFQHEYDHLMGVKEKIVSRSK